MRVDFTAVVAWVPVFMLVGCGDPSRPTSPVAGSSAVSSYLGKPTDVHASASTRLVSMIDACDPATFNARVGITVRTQ